MKICPVRAELLHADGQKDTRTLQKASSRFSQFFERSQKDKENTLTFMSLDVFSTVHHSIELFSFTNFNAQFFIH